jgi:hypothetical protein
MMLTVLQRQHEPHSITLVLVTADDVRTALHLAI